MIQRPVFPLIRTFLERDIPQLGISIPATTMHRFWTMLAHCHGHTLNASEIGRSLGITDKTVYPMEEQITTWPLIRSF